MEGPDQPGRIVTGSRLLGFDLAVLALGWFHRPLHLPPSGSDPVDRLLARLQSEAGHRVVDGEPWHAQARAHLARGDWLARAADASPSGEGATSRDALHETLQLATETRAVIVPVFVRSLGGGKHRLVVTEPVSHRETSRDELAAKLTDFAPRSIEPG